MAMTAEIPFISLPTIVDACTKRCEWAPEKHCSCSMIRTYVLRNAAKGVADTSSSNIPERVLDEMAVTGALLARCKLYASESVEYLRGKAC